MSFPAAAAANPPPDWAAERAELKERIAQLEQQLAWFQRQIFGEKSERRHLEPPPEQMSLGEGLAPAQAPPSRSVAAHSRRLPTKPMEDDAGSGLFFDEARVPVEVIAVPNPEVADLPADAYEVIGEKVTHRLAQRPGSYVILKYVRPLIKRKDTQTLHCPPAPVAVLEGGRADVSFLAGLIIDKFLYHLPLYRQHQRLLAAGIDVSRQWLTQQVLAVALLLAPIVEAQLAAIRACRVKVTGYSAASFPPRARRGQCSPSSASARGTSHGNRQTACAAQPHAVAESDRASGAEPAEYRDVLPR